jgi:hypothetical protein
MCLKCYLLSSIFAKIDLRVVRHRMTPSDTDRIDPLYDIYFCVNRLHCWQLLVNSSFLLCRTLDTLSILYMMLTEVGEVHERVLNHPKIQVPVLPKVTNIVSQIFVNCAFYIFLSLLINIVQQGTFLKSFWAYFLKITCKIAKIRFTNNRQYLVGIIFHKLVWNFTYVCKKTYKYEKN